MRIAMLGNSGSGKSTLGRRLAAEHALPVLDLDGVAWMPGQVAVARPIEEALREVRRFCAEGALNKSILDVVRQAHHERNEKAPERIEQVVDRPRVASRAGSVPDDSLDRNSGGNTSWIVEGCYTQLIAAALEHSPTLILLDPGVERCVANCRNRPWEPEKYASKAEQDARLDFLIDWVRDYYRRDGDMSYAAHVALFERYTGPKEWRRDAT